jgi:hypothetical protein
MFFSHWINIFNTRDSKVRYIPILHIMQVAYNMGTEAVPQIPHHNKSLLYAIRKVQENQEGLKYYGIHRFLIYVDGVNLMSKNRHTMQTHT